MPFRPYPLTEARTAGITSALMALAPVGLLIYTPALPMLEAELGATQAQVQFTVVAFFTGFTFAHLLYGSLSDAFGRRIVTLWAMALFVAATACALVAPNIELLTIARIFQGIGTAAGTVIARAIVRDAYAGRASERILNIMALVLGIGPAFAPFIGGLIVEDFGWRHVFLFMLAYGAILLLVAFMFLPETHVNRTVGTLRPVALARQYWTMATDRRFIIPTLVGTTIGAHFYAVTTALPYVLIVEGGMSTSAFGLTLLAQPLCFSAGTYLAGRLLLRMSLTRLVPAAMAMLTIAALLMPAGVLGFGANAVTVMLPLALTGFALALIMPVLWSKPLEAFGDSAGAAAALYGFFQYGMGLVGSTVVTLIASPAIATVTVMPAMLLIGVLIYLAAWRRQLDPLPPDPRTYPENY